MKPPSFVEQYPECLGNGLEEQLGALGDMVILEWPSFLPGKKNGSGARQVWIQTPVLSLRAITSARRLEAQPDSPSQPDFG